MTTERTWNLILSVLRPLQGSKTASLTLPLEASLLFLPSWTHPRAGRQDALYLLNSRPHWHLCHFCPGKGGSPCSGPQHPSLIPIPDPHPGLWNLHKENLDLTGAIFLCIIHSPGL